MKASAMLSWIDLRPMDRSVFLRGGALDSGPGGVFGGVPPGLPAPPDCCGGVDPGGVLLPPNSLLDCLFLGAVLLLTHWSLVTLLLGMDYCLDWNDHPFPVPPPGLFGGPPPPVALCLVCNGVHSLGYVAAVEMAGTCGTGAGGGGGGGGGICRNGRLPGDLPDPGGPRPSGTPPGALTTLGLHAVDGAPHTYRT